LGREEVLVERTWQSSTKRMTPGQRELRYDFWFKLVYRRWTTNS
jgi:hypothetical protein